MMPSNHLYTKAITAITTACVHYHLLQFEVLGPKMFVAKEVYSCVVKRYVKMTHLIHDEAQKPGLI